MDRANQFQLTPPPSTHTHTRTHTRTRAHTHIQTTHPLPTHNHSAPPDTPPLSSVLSLNVAAAAAGARRTPPAPWPPRC
eukprot:365263-Chlamydomonas_euryale.AAC.25